MRDSLKSTQSASVDSARSLAVGALAFIAADSDRLNRFLSLTGLGPDNLRTAAADPAFLGSVLDYLVGDEALLVEFAADAGLKPEAVARAHAVLRGPTEGEF
ncbi:MAG TPA: DUF3572 domain-containing protein [Roseiarcus sp.]|jgi:hypothetical protein